MTALIYFIRHNSPFDWTSKPINEGAAVAGEKMEIKKERFLSALDVEGWPKNPFSFFCKIKEIFLFSPITSLIWLF